MRRSLPFLILPILLAGCQFGDQLPKQVDPVAVTAPRLPSRAEEAIGERENPRVVAEYGGVYSDADVEAAIASVVGRLVAASDDPSRRYRVTILNSPVANAFALPGGYLYVTRGLLSLTQDPSELAAVLSHEMAHVIANHAIERAKIVEQADIVERVATDVLSDPTISQSARSNSKLSLAKFSRDQEIAADRIGIAITARAGFDPFAAGRFLEKLERYTAFRSALGHRDDAESFLSSHPAGLERRQLANVAAQQQAGGGTASQRRDDAQYLQALDGLVFGDDSSEGFVRGREFLHPRLSIGFRVPPQFRLENTKEAVLAAAGEDTAMRFDGVAADPRIAPTEYLASGWVNGLTEGSIRETSVNGLPAATAEASAGDWVFRIAAVKVGGNMYRLIFADRSNGDAIDDAMRQTLSTFRRLSAAEVARLQPLRIDVVTVRPGETVASLAARMQGTENRLELFRLLNGLQPSDSLSPGMRVKVVSD